MARFLGRIVPAATQGAPSLGVVRSLEWKVGEGADPGPAGGKQLHRSIRFRSTGYEDHYNTMSLVTLVISQGREGI